MASDADLRRAGRLQARLCHEHGSPIYGAVTDGLVGALDEGTDLVALDLLRADPRDAVGSAVYLRLFGAVHRLAMLDPSCPVRRCYPSVGGRPDPAGAAVTLPAVVAANRAFVEREMQRDVQTNDVGRVAPLSAAMRYVVSRLGGPVRLLEPGASAGLNLWPDRYRVDVDTGWLGPERSALRLAGHFTRGSPPVTRLEVVERRGCDVHPITISDERDRRLLRSFVWPDDGPRRARLDAALAAAGQAAIDRADACAWAAAQLRELPAGVTTIVFHSLLVGYLSDAERDRFVGLVRAAGERAQPSHPLAWIALEPWQSDLELALVCELWPGGQRLLLARCSPHGRDVRWQPQPLDADPWSR